jgi:hypothetical protein
MVDAVNFTMGMLTNTYGFQLGTVRGMRDRERGMHFWRSVWRPDRETGGYIKVGINDPLVQLVR